MRANSAEKRLRRGATKSAALLLVHIAICALIVVAALAFRRLGLRFPPCVFYELTGKTCLACGATRAVLALLRFRLARSFLFNPLPLSVGLFMLFTLVWEAVAAIRGRHIPIKRGYIGALVILFIVFVYNILRMTGVAPLPNAL